MPDPITSVAAQSQPPNINQGVGMLSGLVGLQQQQVALRTAQAQSQLEQQKAGELGRVGSLVQNAEQYLKPDGSFDNLRFAADVNRVAPTFGGEIANQATSQANERIHNQQSLQNLNDSQRKALGDSFRSLAQKPNLTMTDVINEADRQIENNPDPSFRRMVLSSIAHIPPNLSSSQLQGAIGGFANAASGAPPGLAQVEQGGQTAVTPVNPATGIPNVGQTTFYGKTLPQTVVTPPGGQPAVVGGAAAPITGPGGSVGGGGTSRGGVNRALAPQYPGPPPTDQDMANFKEYSSNLNARASVAADSLPRIQLLEKATDAIRTGAGSSTREQIARQLQAINAPKSWVDAFSGGDLGKLQEAEKFLFQTTLSGLRQSMQGDAGHVAQFNAADKVFPNVDTDPRARETVLNFLKDQGTRDLMEQGALNTARKVGTFNPATWQADYQQALRGGQVPGVPASQIPQPSAPAKSPFKAPNQAQLQLLHEHPEYADSFKKKFGFLPK